MSRGSAKFNCPYRGRRTYSERGFRFARAIAAETGIDSRKVGALIGLRLLNVYVERRPTRPSGGERHLYRRLRYMDTSRRTPDS